MVKKAVELGALLSFVILVFSAVWLAFSYPNSNDAQGLAASFMVISIIPAIGFLESRWG